MTEDEEVNVVGRILNRLAAQTVISTQSTMNMLLAMDKLPKERQTQTAVIAQTIENAIMLALTLSVDKPEWAHALVSSIDVLVDDDMNTQENHRKFSEAFVNDHPIEMELPAPLAERGGDDELPEVGEILKDFSVGQGE